MTNFAGPIYSFEPDPQTFALLRATAAGDPNWKIFNLALGAKNAVLPFNIMSMSVFNSFRKPAADNKVVTRTDISVVRLDDFIKDQGVSFHTAYLKTDTQGFDLEVLRGSAGIMDCIEAIQTELSFLPIYEKTPDYHVVLRELKSDGFALSGMYPVTLTNGQAIECDCILVREKPLSPEHHVGFQSVML